MQRCLDIFPYFFSPILILERHHIVNTLYASKNKIIEYSMMTWSEKNTAELFINYYYLLWGPEMLTLWHWDSNHWLYRVHLQVRPVSICRPIGTRVAFSMAFPSSYFLSLLLGERWHRTVGLTLKILIHEFIRLWSKKCNFFPIQNLKPRSRIITLLLPSVLKEYFHKVQQ